MSRKLGQHFLKNKFAIKKIIAALDLQPNDALIEIGPGEGALTFPLAEECQKTGCQLMAIEKDPKLAVGLELLSFRKNLELKIEIIKGDALKIIPQLTKSSKALPAHAYRQAGDRQVKAQSYKIVGNIPYYITGKLLRILSELENKPSLSVLMIQKEVAERIIAKPPKMNLLAAAVQFWAEPKILFTLKPDDFDPPPKVKSTVIKLESAVPTSRQEIQNLEFKMTENYYKFIHILFKQPRKTVLNNLATGLKLTKNEIGAALKNLKINPTDRPQNLSLEEIKAVVQLIH